MKRVGVTGATGCLGRALITMLQEENVEINALVRSSSDNLPPGIHRFKGDLTNNKALDDFSNGCDVIFHLAGKVHCIPRSKKEEDEFHHVNVFGTQCLLEAALKNKVKRFLFFSTVAVYGPDSDFEADEKTPCHPRTAYAKSKHKAEMLVRDSNLEGVILRLPLVYGPNDRGNMAQLIQGIQKKKFVYIGGGQAKRSMISAQNAANAAIIAAKSTSASGEIFCVTDGRDPTIKELVGTIKKSLGIEWNPKNIPLFLAKILGKGGDYLQTLTSKPMPINSDRFRKLGKSFIISNQKASALLQYRPVETLAIGISKEVNWLLSKFSN